MLQIVIFTTGAAILAGDGLLTFAFDLMTQDEVHPDPANAKSDGPNMVRLKDFPALLAQLAKPRADQAVLGCPCSAASWRGCFACFDLGQRAPSIALGSAGLWHRHGPSTGLALAPTMGRLSGGLAR